MTGQGTFICMGGPKAHVTLSVTDAHFHQRALSAFCPYFPYTIDRLIEESADLSYTPQNVVESKNL